MRNREIGTERDQQFANYGANRALEAYARHLRERVKAAGDAFEKMSCQRQLNDFNQWRRERRKQRRL